MTLRATAPAFVPSFETDSQPANGSDLRREKEQCSRRRRRRGAGQQRRTQPQQHKEANIHDKPPHQHARTNSRHTKRCGRRRKKKQQENPFPPLVGGNDVANKSFIANTREVHDQKKNWLGVAERAHNEKEKEHRNEAIRLSKLQDETSTVRLTPLVRLSSSRMRETASPSECNTNNEATEAVSPPTAHELHYCTNIDMTRLRNRWWKLLREESVREKQQHDLEEEESDSLIIAIRQEVRCGIVGRHSGGNEIISS